MIKSSKVTRVSGLVFLIFLAIPVTFAAQPSKKTLRKSASTPAHAMKANASVHTVGHPGKVTSIKAKSSTTLRTVSARGTSLRATSEKTAHGKTPSSRWHSRYAMRRPTAPSYQTHPEEERYRQIQQALADRGYFKGEVNGQWGQDSVDALQKFQLDNKLPDIYTDGKINALSLMGLGLGPKHGARADEAVPTPPPPPPPSTLAPAESSGSSASSLPPAQSN